MRHAPANVAGSFRSGDALFVFDTEMTVLDWNEEAEHLTGIPASAAVGRPCWDVLHGVSENGDVVCHAGCSVARLAREGWPVSCHKMLVRTPAGRKLLSISTVAVRREGEAPVMLNILRNGNGIEPTGKPAERLTGRQLEVLQLLESGEPVKAIAARLGIREATARNHVAAVLRRLGCHSQLEAVAAARRRGLL